LKINAPVASVVILDEKELQVGTIMSASLVSNVHANVRKGYDNDDVFKSILSALEKNAQRSPSYYIKIRLQSCSNSLRRDVSGSWKDWSGDRKDYDPPWSSIIDYETQVTLLEAGRLS
jgi:hypothetical protein